MKDVYSDPDTLCDSAAPWERRNKMVRCERWKVKKYHGLPHVLIRSE